MIKYKTVKSEVMPLLEPRLTVLGREGWVLGGITQRTEPVPSAAPVGRRQEVYYFYFWRRVSDQEAEHCCDCSLLQSCCAKHTG